LEPHDGELHLVCISRKVQELSEPNFKKIIKEILYSREEHREILTIPNDHGARSQRRSGKSVAEDRRADEIEAIGGDRVQRLLRGIE